MNVDPHCRAAARHADRHAGGGACRAACLPTGMPPYSVTLPYKMYSPSFEVELYEEVVGNLTHDTRADNAERHYLFDRVLSPDYTKH